MNKSEILALDNDSLLAHLLDMESITTNEVNSSRGITKKSIKDYKWTLDEVCKRFNLNLDIVAEKAGVDHWWDVDENGNS